MLSEHCATPKAFNNSPASTATATLTNASSTSIAAHKRSSKDEHFLLSSEPKTQFNSTQNFHHLSSVAATVVVASGTNSIYSSAKPTTTPTTTTRITKTTRPTTVSHFNRYPMTKQLSTATAPPPPPPSNHNGVNVVNGGGGGVAFSSSGSSNATAAAVPAGGGGGGGGVVASTMINGNSFAATFLHNNNLTPTIISPTASLSPTATVPPNLSSTATKSPTTNAPSKTTGTIPKKCLTRQTSATSATMMASMPNVVAATATAPSPSTLPPPNSTLTSATTTTTTPTVSLTNHSTSLASQTSTSTPSVANIKSCESSSKLAAAEAAKKASAASSSSSSSNDANGRSAALERAYVHDVYEHCEEPTGSLRPRVAQFLSNLEAGSVVCDVGCGSGRYLTQCNPSICTVGVDRCYRLSRVAKEKGGEVALCDNLELPFRDESFDAVLSIAVVHHFATTERRVNALRELARILRIGGRVVITVWALEQRHRRFESQDVLIPWQPPKNRNFNYSDEEDDEDYLPPYHAYTEDSTNSSRSAGDGDSSSLSSSSPGESCYSFVRRAIQKLAGGRKHAWFLESWTSKDTKNDSSMDYEDAKDLPIELRRLEDFEDFTDPPLSAGLKSRSLGSILNPPPRQIVRSRSSVPSLGGPLVHVDNGGTNGKNLQFLDAPTHSYSGAAKNGNSSSTPSSHSNGHSPTNHPAATSSSSPSSFMSPSSLSRRPKLIKQKQSLCDEDYQLPDAPFHMLSHYNMNTNGVSSALFTRSSSATTSTQQSHLTTRQMRKQSSLNEELMAGNRIREKERVRKRIQKQMSLNEAFLCRSALFSRRLQVIREGFTSKIKSSTGSLERVTKTGITKIMQNLKTTNEEKSPSNVGPNVVKASKAAMCTHEHHHHHHHHYQQQQQQQQQQQNSPLVSNFQTHLHHLLHRQNTTPTSAATTTNKFAGPVTICKNLECAATACYCQTYHQGCSQCNAESSEEKARRHSRESGSDSSKDSSLQSDTSIESEDSFASVIFIPKPEQHQQQLNYQKQHQNSNSSSSNSSSSNGGGGGGCHVHKTCCQSRCVSSSSTLGGAGGQCCKLDMNGHRISSVPTSPLIMPCPPTPAHSPAAAQTQVTSPPQSVPAVIAAMAMFTPPLKSAPQLERAHSVASDASDEKTNLNGINKTRFNFDEAHIKQQETKDLMQQQLQQQTQKSETQLVVRPAERAQEMKENSRQPLATNSLEPKITRQTIKDLPPIPKFRKQQSLQISRQNFPIVRRTTTATGGSAIAAIPKLMSLELFNPATDDLDSDSSEPSSPDSVDSVISAPRSNALTAAPSLDQTKDLSPTASEKCSDATAQNQNDTPAEKAKSLGAAQDIIVNDDAGDIVPTKYGGQQTNPPQDCAEFAEKLSAQLMRELEEKTHKAEAKSRSLESMNDDLFDDPFAPQPTRKRNGEKDLAALRDELRERRLMLANLSTQPSLNQSPNSSSTSSLSSQTRSFTIHEEDEEEDEEEHERSYSLQLYENCKISKLNYKRHLQSNNLHPETTYLLQDEDSSFKDEEEENEFEEIEHDVIPEEDEDDEDEASQDNDRSSSKTKDNTLKCDSLDDKEDETKKSSGEETTLQNRNQSTESWEHSNSSTTSLDSPSQGGATTHHRYYHVFREGELDALINHHVASLHIVSSYYERASWCVVAEKVQVWTI
uniref:Methyltransferase type 11 domain-containing protein n=1 Tax=Stomoxys calcitrans TaxID=35570 RepID=A0A1I8P077_STOCA